VQPYCKVEQIQYAHPLLLGIATCSNGTASATRIAQPTRKVVAYLNHTTKHLRGGTIGWHKKTLERVVQVQVEI